MTGIIVPFGAAPAETRECLSTCIARSEACRADPLCVDRQISPLGLARGAIRCALLTLTIAGRTADPIALRQIVRGLDTELRLALAVIEDA